MVQGTGMKQSFPIELIVLFFPSMIYTIMPVYLSEMTPKDSRGMLSSTIGPTYLGGYLFALCTNVGYAKFPLGWRVTMAVAALGGLIYLIGLMLMPHSPR